MANWFGTNNTAAPTWPQVRHQAAAPGAAAAGEWWNFPMPMCMPPSPVLGPVSPELEIPLPEWSLSESLDCDPGTRLAQVSAVVVQISPHPQGSLSQQQEQLLLEQKRLLEQQEQLRQKRLEQERELQELEEQVAHLHLQTQPPQGDKQAEAKGCEQHAEQPDRDVLEVERMMAAMPSLEPELRFMKWMAENKGRKPSH